MAVTEELPDVDVSVFVDGVALKEYHDTDVEEEARTVTRYIEATSGKSFEVHIKVNKSCKFLGNCIAFGIYVDGEGAVCPLIQKKICCKSGETNVSMGINISPTQLTRYIFTSLETVSDDFALKDEAARVKDLGIIRIKATHNLLGKRVPMSTPKGGSGVGFVSEKAIKGQTISHGVGFSDPIIARSTTYESAAVSGQPNPFAVYEFRYRSLEALKSLLIIPRTPTPPPLEERDITTLSPDEMRELQRRARAAKDEREAKIKIKREHVDENPRQRKKARPNADSTQLELDDNGCVRTSSTPTVAERVVIELD
ncbi:hypothetical protein LTR08_002007 [Meristemomyces frigidus]|nr:hypothetical protein LTR08_002007 [Meristemomyces frigidus]